jgi:GNAT superfamily N-acetyltransferase
MGTDVMALVAQTGDGLAGFIIGVLTTAPPVYIPGGAVCMVDDLAVAPPAEWQAVGSALLAAMAQEAQARGAILMVVVCAQRDQAKRALLQEAGRAVASEWHVGALSPLRRSADEPARGRAPSEDGLEGTPRRGDGGRHPRTH